MQHYQHYSDIEMEAITKSKVSSLHGVGWFYARDLYISESSKSTKETNLALDKEVEVKPAIQKTFVSSLLARWTERSKIEVKPSVASKLDVQNDKGGSLSQRFMGALGFSEKQPDKYSSIVNSVFPNEIHEWYINSEREAEAAAKAAAEAQAAAAALVAKNKAAAARANTIASVRNFFSSARRMSPTKNVTVTPILSMDQVENYKAKAKAAAEAEFAKVQTKARTPDTPIKVNVYSDSSGNSVPEPVSTESIGKYREDLYTEDPATIIEATQQFRRLLSIEKQPPIQQVIDSGVVPRFVQFLMRNEIPELQFEATW